MRELLDSDDAPSVEEVLSDETDELSFYQRYDARWLVTELLLAEHPEEYRGIVQRIRQLGGGEGFTERVVQEIEKALGRDFKRLDKAFATFVSGLEPTWREEFRSF